MKTIKLTPEEIDLIQAMMAIADAGQWGEGDYQGWDNATAKVFYRLVRKLQVCSE